jgi:hypothetical protein
MKKIILLAFCAGTFSIPVFAQQKVMPASPAYDNIHLEKIMRNDPRKFDKYALIENERQQPRAYYHKFSPGILSLNRPTTFPQLKQYNFEKGLFKINNYSTFGILAKPGISY